MGSVKYTADMDVIRHSFMNYEQIKASTIFSYAQGRSPTVI